MKAGRDPSPDVKAAAARATGRLLLAQAEEGQGAPPQSLPMLLSTGVALLGMDQDSGVWCGVCWWRLGCCVVGVWLVCG